MEPDDGVFDSRIYVTFHREYLVRGRACVRIRDRQSGRWGPVLPNRVLGSLPKGEADAEFVCDFGVGPPRLGDRLCIQVGGERVVSSPILAIEPAPRRESDQ